MAYTNSPLVSYTKLSPNHSGQRKHTIDTITIHCVVGQCSVETLGNIFAPTSRQASSNYGIGKDGRIGMYVEEKNRSWCTSSSANDNRAITIEVASDTKHPYAVNDKAYAALLDLVTDICKRNGIEKLVWSTVKNDRVNHLNGCNMTVHRDYANKSCPGDYLYNLHGEIAAEVNKRLGQTEAADPEPTTPAPVVSEIKEGDLVKIADNAVYYSGKSVPSWVKDKHWYVVKVEGDRAVIDDSEDGKNAINSPINTKYLTVVKAAENGSESVEKVELVKGAVVTFTGKKHYSSANGKTPVSCKPGKATITLDPYLKGKHPYHLVAVKGGTSNVYGWVDAEDIYEYNAQKKTEGFKPYLVKVTASALNIRKGAGTSYPVVGCIGDKGIYTIVAEDNGWGKLKSGAGWISLAYTKRV